MTKSHREPSTVPKNTPPPMRTEKQEALLQEALARPGTPELMRVYGSRPMQEPYRDAMRDRPEITDTDHSGVNSS